MVNIVYVFFDTFGIIDAMTGGGPSKATETLVYKVFFDGRLGGDLGSSAAQSVVLMVIVVGLTAFQFRYIERNPVRAGLVARAEDWRWSSAQRWVEPSSGPCIEAGPVVRPEPWLAWVNQTMTEVEVEQIRQSVNRGAPFGSTSWTTRTASLMGLDASLRPIGRPPKPAEN